MSDRTKALLEMTIPNLPGMIPSNESWIYRQKDGFHRSYNPRPRSAMAKSITNNMSEIETSLTKIHSLNQEFENKTQFIRPSTAGNERTTLNILTTGTRPLPSNFTAKPQMRPSSAVPLGRNSLASRFSNSVLSNFGLPRVDPEVPQRKQLTVPQYVENDKVVCRFYGYFIEERVWARDTPLGVPTIENDMFRKLIILYYVDDNTIAMTEPKSSNTGVHGGDFFKRNPLYKSNGEPVSLTDLAPGNSFFALGREIFINSADAFTRDFFRREYGIILSPPLETPETIREDLGAMYATGLVSHFPSRKTNYGTRSNDYEVTRESNDKTNRYLKYDGKVLRFQCIETKYLDSKILELPANQMYAPGSAKRFALSYFLSDNKIDIRVVKPSSASSSTSASSSLILEDSMLVLKKSKLARNWRQVQRGQEPRFYQPEDLLCGSIIDIYGREFLLINCDPFSRQFYEKLNINQTEVPILFEEEEEIIHPVPKLGDGFLAIGSEEDTLATIYGMPKVQRDIKKAHKNQHRLLRCKLVLCTNNIIEASRVFALTYYLEDDTLQIFEEVGRNSGLIGGSFLKRGKYINLLPLDSDQPRYFIPTDLFLGNVVSIIGNEMKIIEMDNVSLKFCENCPDEYPMFDPFFICYNLMDYLKDCRVNLRKLFRESDPNNSRMVTKQKCINILTECGIVHQLNDQQILTLLRRVQSDLPLGVHEHITSLVNDDDIAEAIFVDPSTNNKSNLSKNKDYEHVYFYNELCDLLSHSYFLRTLSNSGYNTRNHADEIKNKLKSKGFDNLKSLLKYCRERHTQWRRIFRRDIRTFNDCVSLDVLNKVLNKNGIKLSEVCLNELQNAYTVSQSIAIAALKQIEKTESSVMKEKLTIDREASRRPDFRSSLRLSQSYLNKRVDNAVDDYMEGLTNSNNRRLQSIQQRRDFLLQTKRFDPTFKPKQDSLPVPIQHSAVVVNFNNLCDDIYVCDWL